MAEDEVQRLPRQVTSTNAREDILYTFSVEIYVRQAPLDENRVRQLIDAELQRLGTAIKNAQ